MAAMMRTTPAMRCAPVLSQRTNATSARVVRAQAAKKLAGSTFTGVQMRVPPAVSNGTSKSFGVSI
eukprot:2899998-Pyramimonas_sp.AAC.1